MGEVEVADQRSGRSRLAPDRRRGLAPGNPREREGLAVVVMQPRDVDLVHRAAMR